MDPVVAITYATTVAAPLVTLASLRLVRQGRHGTHRAIQIALLCVCTAAVLALEIRIRLDGGSGSIVATAPLELRRFTTVLLYVHITIAVATYIAWGWLAVASARRYGRALPGSFSRTHRRAGRWVLAGLIATAVLSTGITTILLL